MEPLAADLSAAFATPALPWLLLGGYLSGSIPFGYLIAKLKGGGDIRQQGSGNIGATNVARVIGKRLGLLTLVLDAAKGMIPVAITWLWHPATEQAQPTVEAMVALAALLGHCFPVWLGFRGGKGVATAAGVLAVQNPLLAASGMAAFAVVFGITRVVSLSSIVAALVLPPTYFLMNGGSPDGQGVPYVIILLVVIGKHHGNIRRLLAKEELSL
jgi:glycerol-3-phosphate acyltransferase PlsY